MKMIIRIYILAVIITSMFSSCTNQRSAGEKQQMVWLYNEGKALQMASEQRKPVMIDFMATWCPPCQRMEDSTFSDIRVIDKANLFIRLRIDVDKYPEIADKYNGNARKYGGTGIPNILFLSYKGSPLKHIVGYQSAGNLTAVMDTVLTLTRL